MNDELESKVQAILQEMTTKYLEIEAAIDTLPTEPSTWSPAQYDQVTQHKLDVAAFETSNESILNAYRESRPKGSPIVKQLRDQATEVLLRLINKMEQLETRARSAKEKLAPEINQKVRATQMLNAYGSE